MELWACILGSGAVAAIVAGVFQLINRWLDNKGEKAKKMERDILRTQLLLLLLLRPTQKKEIMDLAQHYFNDLHGNWYMTDMFNSWLEENGDSKPEWFRHK